MSILSSLLFSECARVCDRMSDQWSWTRLCCKCKRVYCARYGTEEIPTDPNDPLEAFDDTNVERNVMRFVVYILLLKANPIHLKSISESEITFTICGEPVPACINF